MGKVLKERVIFKDKMYRFFYKDLGKRYYYVCVEVIVI